MMIVGVEEVFGYRTSTPSPENGTDSDADATPELLSRVLADSSYMN
jgi:hypothetical protein